MKPGARYNLATRASLYFTDFYNYFVCHIFVLQCYVAMARIFFTVKATSTTRKHQKLIHVGDCLYRSSRTDVYYAIFQREGRQVKRSLKTTIPNSPSVVVRYIAKRSGA